MDAVPVTCPYCFESMELLIDPDTTGHFVQDCDVCCHPWNVSVFRDHQGSATVDVERAQ